MAKSDDEQFYYDDFGRLAERRVEYDYENKPTYSETYEYDDNGAVTMRRIRIGGELIEEQRYLYYPVGTIVHIITTREF